MFQTKKILLGLCLIGLGPDSLVSRYIHAVTVKKSSRKNTLLVCFFAREEESCFHSFSPFPYSPGELEKGKGKGGRVVPFPLLLVALGKGEGED